MRLRIDLERCVMAGECIYNHPSLFRWGDDDYPRPVVDELTTDVQRREAAEAMAVCPSGAISVTDA